MNVYTSYRSLFSQLAIDRGDIVYVISDILKLMCVCRENHEPFDGQVFINSLLEKVGPEGTVLFPTFNWSFCRGEAFHYQKTLSQTGGLSNVALQRPDFRRTRHPIYSFAVWGKAQNELCDRDYQSAFGAESPFQFFYENNAKNVCIGIDYKDSCTFVHYAEEMAPVPYRFLKPFTAGYTDAQGTLTKSYQMFVRKEGVGTTMIHPDNDIVLGAQGAHTRTPFNSIAVDLLQLGPTGDTWISDLRGPQKLIYTQLS